ncbi:hypothetical protein P8452_00434 [Trifolium repens]|nr:hypothetical protein P8452_00434 [Trifolium repens]
MKALFILLLIFSIDFGNEVQMLEAKECDPVVPDFCHTWRNIVCKLKCKIVCKSWSAHGQCLDDHACHCHCC